MTTNSEQQHDLRSFLSFVKEHHSREFLAIEEKLSAQWELAAVIEKLEQKFRAPIVQFNTVDQSSYPVVSNVCASWTRVAKEFGISVAQLEERFKQSYDNPIAPQLWQSTATPPVREQVLKDQEIDLRELPQIRYTETESHPYISAACVVAEDKQSGALNLSYHRLMIVDANHVAICASPGGHLEQIIQDNQVAKQNTNIAVFIGAHPMWSLGSLAAGALELEEYHVIGGLLGYPLSVVPGIHDPKLLIPSRAEIALEGEISASETVAEGPYGEAFGYVAEVSDQPLLRVRVMSSRHKPLFQDIVPGKMEHLNMTGSAARLTLQKTLYEQFPELCELHMVGPMTLYLSVDPGSKDHRKLIDWVLRTQRFIKQLVVFDNDIDLQNIKQCQWAIAVNTQAHRDLVIIEGLSGNGLDPSEIAGNTSKWGIDATAKPRNGKLPLKNKIPQQALDRIDIKSLLEK